MASKFVSTAEICPVCNEKVYAMDRFVIEKMVIHKGCFKCKHCGGKLGLSNFAAVNQQVYCKTHYLQLFRESGGRYDKAFGDGGFEKTSQVQGYVPGQFKGVGAPPVSPPVAASTPPKAATVAASPQQETTPPPNVKEMMKKFNEPAFSSPSGASGTSAAVGGGKVKDMMKKFEKADLNESSTSALDVSVDSIASTTSDKKSAYLAAASSSSPSGTKAQQPVGASGSISDRIKLYSANASSSSSSLPPAATAVEETAAPPGKLTDRLQQYVTAAEGSNEAAPAAEESSPVVKEASVAEEEAPVEEETAPAVEEEAAVEEKVPVEEEAPVEEETAPAVEEEAPVEEETAPAVEEEAPVEEETAPAVEEEAPVEEETTPAVEEEAAVEEEVPVEEEQAPAEEKEIPIAEEEAPVGEEEVAPATTEEEEDATNEQFTPIKGRSSNTTETEAPASIMKQGDSFRTPNADRNVRFGGAVEVIEDDGNNDNNSSSSSEEVEDDDTATYTPINRVRSSSGHSATKGSALASYLNIMDEQARQARAAQRAAATPPPMVKEEDVRSPTPPPPILSPGSHYVSHKNSSVEALASAVTEEENNERKGTMNLGDELPNIQVDTTLGSVHLYDYFAASWGILFSHPADFTPVCTTELRIAADLFDEFASRNCKLLALSCDSVESHLEWIKDLTPVGTEFPFPIIADESRDIARRFGMLDAKAKDKQGIPLTARAVFVFGPDRLLKLSILYPATTGRNFIELIRVLDSLQLTAQAKVATPVDWKHGEECIVSSSVQEKDYAELFPFGVRQVDLPSGKPYLKFTPDPSDNMQQQGERHVSFAGAPPSRPAAYNNGGGLNLGDEMPNFECESTSTNEFHFHDAFEGDNWVILFSHPADFTPVCTTELARASQLVPEFAKRQCKLFALSCDSVESHLQWIADVQSFGGAPELGFPILADPTREIATRLGMLDAVAKDSEGLPLTARAVFICGPDRLLKLMILYPATTGRNMQEILRALDSLQLTAKHRLATPGNWRQGDECIVSSSVSNEEAVEMFPAGVRTEELASGKPYLRYTAQPE